MKIAFNGIKTYYNNSDTKTNSPNNGRICNSTELCNSSVCSSLKPIPTPEKLKRAELKEIGKLIQDKKVFSLDKAVELIKNKTDSQLMLYSEDDIKEIVSSVMAQNPDSTREEVLSVLSKLSSFSNYDSLSIIENYCKENNINEVFKTENLTANNIFSYFSGNQKLLLKLAINKDSEKNSIVFIDRDTIKELKKIKNDPSSLSFYMLKTGIKAGTIKPVILDGWEAKTNDGLKSFNIIGAWENLEQTVSSVLKAQKSGKNPFIDDIVSDLKSVLGEDVPFDILENNCENPDEKAITQRLNPKTISKDEIKKKLKNFAKYSVCNFIQKDQKQQKYSAYERNNNYTKSEKAIIENVLKSLQKNEIDIFDKDTLPQGYQQIMQKEKLFSVISYNVIEALTKVIYSSMDVYSPRRIATELKSLNQQINNKLLSINKTPDDVLFVVPKKEKSYGLISYQYSKVNNTDSSQFIYPNHKNLRIDSNVRQGKVFVFMDDFSGSAQSLLRKELPYENFKKTNPAQPFIFATLSSSEYSKNEINKAVLMMKNSLQRETNDCLISVNTAKDMKDYIKLLKPEEKKPLSYLVVNGYNSGSNIIVFPHVIPDNCADISGVLFKPLIKSITIDKTKMGFFKKLVITQT